MVIFNHTMDRGFYRYATDIPGTLLSVFNLLPSIACKAAVPIFFMISGALLLEKQERIGKTYRRTFRVIVDILLFSLLYYGVDAYLTVGLVFDLKKTLLDILQKSYWHLWYLYAYLMLLITLPFFRDFAVHLKRSHAVLLYAIAVIYLCMMPVFEYFVFKIYGQLKPSWILSVIFIYPLLGYIIHTADISKIRKRDILLLWLFNLFCFVISELAEYQYLCREPLSRSETFLQITCIINAPLIFLTVKWLSQNIKCGIRLANGITGIGKCTFGIYLLHILIQWKIRPLYLFWTNILEQGYLGRQWGVYVTSLAVFVISGVTTWLLRKIPVIRKLF